MNARGWKESGGIESCVLRDLFFNRYVRERIGACLSEAFIIRAVYIPFYSMGCKFFKHMMLLKLLKKEWMDAGREDLSELD